MKTLPKAIAVLGCGRRSLLGIWEGDRFWGVGERSLLGYGGAIAFWDVEGRSLFGVWEGDRFLGCGRAIAVLGM
ncbi:hypothetical protein H6F47_00220 [Sphaerospermopsis sp. FACHB-1094]|uniref:hypothetical protein n=1 Tax=Sphaerospermopsis sp. FACHB-1094 TaxID=2692861 RepID=UPI001688EA89|nr:hypothetical protein [Sphaerospermopsis sp. FACHB-1094]MBD2130935.1 hypothetical protein [Sphaerospermopsis sp. FACHB-1094]